LQSRADPAPSSRYPSNPIEERLDEQVMDGLYRSRCGSQPVRDPNRSVAGAGVHFEAADRFFDRKQRRRVSQYFMLKCSMCQ